MKNLRKWLTWLIVLFAAANLTLNYQLSRRKHQLNAQLEASFQLDVLQRTSPAGTPIPSSTERHLKGNLPEANSKDSRGTRIPPAPTSQTILVNQRKLAGSGTSQLSDSHLRNESGRAVPAS